MSTYLILIGLDYDVKVEEYNGTNTYVIKVYSNSGTWYSFTKISNQEISRDDASSLGKAEIYVKSN
ncbi:hypothetical protein [Thalassobellus suaedae]|nr:hypothetical protein RHP51_00645 [Flavobacteriaceae bacterium HL-DH14]